MCFAMAMSRPGRSALIAVDKRTGLHFKDGTYIGEDFGGKLLRVGNGWLAMGGDCFYSALAYEMIFERQTIVLSRDLAELSNNALATIQNRWPGAPTDLTHTHYLAASLDVQGHVAAIRYDGEVIQSGSATAITVYPNAYPEQSSTQALRDREHFSFAARLLASEANVWALIRIIAAEIAKVSSRIETVSPAMELAAGDGYLSADSREIAEASEAEIQKRLTLAPLFTPEENPFLKTFNKYATI